MPQIAGQANLDQALQIEVPIVVRLAERNMRVSEVLRLLPGSIIELPKPADSDLDLMVNNKVIGTGVAVKVGENFGIRLTFVGDLVARFEAMNAMNAEQPSGDAGQGADGGSDFEALAAALMMGQDGQN
jgi:flagellar motor switch protein FliN/FliY